MTRSSFLDPEIWGFLCAQPEVYMIFFKSNSNLLVPTRYFSYNADRQAGLFGSITAARICQWISCFVEILWNWEPP